MFGRFFGSPYYGDTYWGPGGGAPPVPAGSRKLPIMSPLGIGRMVAQLGGMTIWKSKPRPPTDI